MIVVILLACAEITKVKLQPFSMNENLIQPA